MRRTLLSRWVVSILTRPEGRVQRAAPARTGWMTSFNPHPSRRTGATGKPCTDASGEFVSILTRPEGRVQHGPYLVVEYRDKFQSSPVPKDGCNWRGMLTSFALTCFNPHPSRRTGATSLRPTAFHAVQVSILTRPEGRVQPTRRPASNTRKRFQSSPVPKDGCNMFCCWLLPQLLGFQSSPVPKDGCNRVTGALPGCSTMSFNPHPSRRTGATDEAGVQRQASSVSILTRPEGRVQRRTTALNSTLWSNFSALSPC